MADRIPNAEPTHSRRRVLQGAAGGLGGTIAGLLLERRFGLTKLVVKDSKPESKLDAQDVKSPAQIAGIIVNDGIKESSLLKAQFASVLSYESLEEASKEGRFHEKDTLLDAVGQNGEHFQVDEKEYTLSLPVGSENTEIKIRNSFVPEHDGEGAQRDFGLYFHLTGDEEFLVRNNRVESYNSDRFSTFEDLADLVGRVVAFPDGLKLEPIIDPSAPSGAEPYFGYAEWEVDGRKFRVGAERSGRVGLGFSEPVTFQ